MTLPVLPDTEVEIDTIPEEVYMDSFPKMKLRKGGEPITAIGTMTSNIGKSRVNVDKPDNSHKIACYQALSRR